MTKKVVRLSDVALAAATSAKTASRVINGDPRVAPETRRRVEEAVTRLGYRVDLLARSLRRGVDDTIGVIVESIADPFFAAVISEIELAALRRGLNVIVTSNRRLPNREVAIVDSLQQRRVAGLIITPHTSDLSYLAATDTPVVFVDRHPRNFPADVVTFDDRGGARMAVRHLLRYGHQRVAFVSDDLEVETSRNRHAGYVDALMEADLPVAPELVATDCADAAVARARTCEFLDLDEPPTAIFSARSETSLGVVKVLHDRKRTDIATVSFGDFALADVLSPAITVLEQSPELLGRLAAERLFARLDGDHNDPVNTVIPLRLVPRGSGEIVPSGGAETVGGAGV
ncbi:LacI family transcriptional regulator [Planosporangium flavigriseum]|uniref:LacI family DNA-binding transcriptional regulator n=1 Tax=Planosporangium flavigriseum TaxID=373681 RepID=UPI001439076B|nr:LacI family DNA-binding transcriptional regulator [Planosporangium flavigriseum]NJC67625.1 LacI family transcriptional regulator [Planosporangium flavigriseum]